MDHVDTNNLRGFNPMENERLKKAALGIGSSLIFTGAGILIIPWMIGAEYTRGAILLGAVPGLFGIGLGIIGALRAKRER